MEGERTASERATRFMRALQEAEHAGRADGLAALFGEDAELTNLARREPLRGRGGVGEFWRDYLVAFGRVRSEFTRVLEGGDHAVLEWASAGELADGRPIAYRGVSVLEWDGGQVRRFRTYYDSAAFLPQPGGSGARKEGDHA